MTKILLIVVALAACGGSKKDTNPVGGPGEPAYKTKQQRYAGQAPEIFVRRNGRLDLRDHGRFLAMPRSHETANISRREPRDFELLVITAEDPDQSPTGRFSA